MSVPEKPRSREELALLAVRIGAKRYPPPAVVQVEVRHAAKCPLPAGARFCMCDVDFTFTVVA
jgi:hypothetical protein